MKYYFLLLILLKCLLLDCAIADSGHPHGIISGHANTIVQINSTNFNISGGEQCNNNLFYSFEKFNLHSGESAVFNDNGFDNSIARVTGTNHSWINGKIESHSNNFWLMNPNGIMFGENATLDIKGSFHVTTADYLQSDNDEKFFADADKHSILLSSPPIAYGFIDDSVSPITFHRAQLSINPQKKFSIVSGDIIIENSMFNISEGTINIAAVNSQGIAYLTDLGIDVSLFDRLANIEWIDQTNISISGKGSGNIHIRAAEFVSNNSTLESITEGDYKGGITDIQVKNMIFDNGSKIVSEHISLGFENNNTSEIKGGNVSIIVEKSCLLTKSKIMTSTNTLMNNAVGAGDAGNVNIQAEKINLIDSNINSVSIEGGNSGQVSLIANDSITLVNSKIHTYSFVASTEISSAGTISIEAERIDISNGSEIGSKTGGLSLDGVIIGGKGDGGDINIIAQESVNFFGVNNEGEASTIITNTYGTEENAGKAGNIYIAAHNLTFQDSGGIVAGTEGTGDGGKIVIDVKNQLEINGVNPNGEYDKYGSKYKYFGSGIYARSDGKGKNSGDAGEINISSNTILITNGGVITNSTSGTGDGGNMQINASTSIQIAGYAKPEQGNIPFEKKYHSGIYSRTEGSSSLSGDGGKISIVTSDLKLTNEGKITTSSSGDGNAGLINLTINNIKINKASILSASFLKGNGGNAGKININSQNNIILNNEGLITTETFGKGNAGLINLNSKNVYISNKCTISSASHLNSNKGGASGTIVIDAKDKITLINNSILTTKAKYTGNIGTKDDKLNGKIIINAIEQIFISNSQISSNISSTLGLGGDISIDPLLLIFNNGNVSGSAFLRNGNFYENGRGGNVTIQARNSIINTNSVIYSTSLLKIPKTNPELLNIQLSQASDNMLVSLTENSEKNGKKNNKENEKIIDIDISPSSFVVPK